MKSFSILAIIIIIKIDAEYKVTKVAPQSWTDQNAKLKLKSQIIQLK